MADILKEIEKERAGAEKWVAAEYSYTQKTLKELKRIETDIGTKKAKGDINRASRDLRWVGRGEYRAARFENRLIEDLKKLIGELPESFKEKIKHLESQIEVAVNHLKEKCSMYAGDLKAKINELATAENQLEAIEQAGKDATAQKAIVLKLLTDVENQVKDEAKWMAALELNLKNVEQFETQINAWVQA